MYLWISIAFINVHIIVSSAELYSALTELDQLLDAQKMIIGVLDGAMLKTERKIQEMKRLKDNYENLLVVSNTSFEQFVSNPINAFILIKKLTVEWDETKKFLTSPSEDINVDFENATFPDKTDLLGAAQALLRLQQTYDLEINAVAEGDLAGSKAEFTLSADDCYELGRQAVYAGYYDFAISWLGMSYEKLQKNPVQFMRVTEDRILNYIKLATFESGRSSAWFLAQGLMSLVSHSVANDQLQQKHLSEQSLPSTYSFHTDPKDFSDYQRLCQSDKQMPSQGYSSHNLKCQLLNGASYHFLQPIKEEELWKEPKISVYHHVISDREIEVLKTLAKPKLVRAEVAEYTGKFSHRVSETRVTKIAWLQVEDDPVVANVYRRIEQVTGLSTETAEAFQVANYGLGGHFHLHLDVLPAAEVYFGSRTGNRIATWLTYLSDVDGGGATVFPRLNLTVWPEKGSALFWYNIRSDGFGDFLTLHGACPVVTGSKWVSNLWLHERGQEFRLKCGKHPTSSLHLTRST